jgi:hypothetical protein
MKSDINRKGKNNPMFHKTPSEETRKRISESLKKWWKRKEMEEELKRDRDRDRGGGGEIW